MTSRASTFLFLKVLNITLDILRQFYFVLCLVLWKLLLVSYCVVVWVLFIVFSIMSFDDSTKCQMSRHVESKEKVHYFFSAMKNEVCC